MKFCNNVIEINKTTDKLYYEYFYTGGQFKMNRNEREFLLNELIEHTMDCDCAKSQHFYDEKNSRKKAKIFNYVQSITFLLTIATYVLIVSGIQQYSWLNFAGIVLTLVSTLLEIMSYMLRFDEEAMNHWKAAQMYSELYRKCQFFCSDYQNESLDVWRARLNDISEELSRISSLSPSVSEKSYSEWAKYGYSKKYPVHKAVLDLKVNQIDNVIQAIINSMVGYKIEIFLFGSYFKSMHYNDIDIAVILHEDERTLALKEKMNDIEKAYSVKGVDLDITIISEKDIIANRCTQFIKNICDGECYYKSPEVKKSIKDEYESSVSNYYEMVQYFCNQADNNKNDYRSFTSSVFYMYYHSLAWLLEHFSINWYGEKSMIIECEYLATEESKMKSINIDSQDFSEMLKHVRLFMDEKNVSNIERKTDDNDFATLIGYYEADKVMVNKIVDAIK